MGGADALLVKGAGGFGVKYLRKCLRPDLGVWVAVPLPSYLAAVRALSNWPLSPVLLLPLRHPAGRIAGKKLQGPVAQREVPMQQTLLPLLVLVKKC